MSIKKMKKEELELLSYKDITNLLIEEYGAQNTPTLFKKIVDLLELPSSYYESKIGDYYMMLTTDKRFIALENGEWDLRNKHTSDKIVKIEEDEEETENEEMNTKQKEIEDEPDEFSLDSEEYDEDDSDDDYKDLVIVDEEELDLE